MINSVLGGFTSVKKILDGLLGIVFAKALLHRYNYWKNYSKNFEIYFLGTIFYYPVPSFAAKSYFCTYIGATKPVTLPVTPKYGGSTVFMSAIGCNPYGDSILLRTLSISSPKVAKTKQMTFFSTFFKITFVLNFSSCQQS
jgi:hypothetical protein